MTITIPLLPWIFLAHFIGDFVFQSHWMAKNKSSNGDALLWHVFVYSLVMLVFIALYTQINFQWGPNVAIPVWAGFALITFVSHFLTDLVTSRVVGVIFESAMKDYKQGFETEFGRKYHDYFVVIGFDQTLHLCTLWLTLKVVGLL